MPTLLDQDKVLTEDGWMNELNQQDDSDPLQTKLYSTWDINVLRKKEVYLDINNQKLLQYLQV